MTTFTLAGRLAAGRRTTSAGRIDVLAIGAFAISAALLETVVAGAHMFYQRTITPPVGMVAEFGGNAEQAAGQAGFWLLLAVCASVLLIVPIVTLGGAAARMGALGRDRRLAALRLLGVTPGEVVRLTAVETMIQAGIGTLIGTAVYLVTVPGWQLLSFQASPLTPAEMFLPIPLIAALAVGLVLLAGVSAVLGLRQVRISPLGVARQAGRPHTGWLRFAVFVVVLVAWNVLAPIFLRQLDGVGPIVTALAIGMAVFMGVINLVGPFLLTIMARLGAKSRRLPLILASRRILADARGAWRSVAGLAFVGFVGGTLLSLPSLDTADADPLTRLVAVDIRTGTALALAISFLVAAASTSLNQAAAVLDRRTQLVHLDHVGAPRGLFHAIRRHEVLGPTAVSALGSAGVAASFFSAAGADVGESGTGLALLAGVLAAGIVVVWLASEGCRPLLRDVLVNPGPRVD